MDASLSRPLFAAGILSMFLTPSLVRAAPHLTAGARLLVPLSRLLGARSISETEPERSSKSGHVIVVGYGVAGRLAAQALSSSQIPFLVLELNAEVVRSARKSGAPVYYADASSEEALGHAHLSEAKALVLLMNDPATAKRVVDTARRLAPQVPVLTRTRYLAEREQLLLLGASDVVAEEVEAGVEVVARLLRRLTIPRNIIESCLHDAREVTQHSSRSVALPRPSLAQHTGLSGLKIESVQLLDGSPGVSFSAAELAIRTRTHSLIVALERDGQRIEVPSPHEPLRAGDVVYLVGSQDAVGSAVALLLGPPTRTLSSYSPTSIP